VEEDEGAFSRLPFFPGPLNGSINDASDLVLVLLLLILA